MPTDRWQNQEEALEFSLQHPFCMLDMEMGTGKTRVAIDTVFARKGVHRILVVCPKAVIVVWRENLVKFAPYDKWCIWDNTCGTVAQKEGNIKYWLHLTNATPKQFVIINYDIVWRKPLGDANLTFGFDMIILDESHRAKSAGSKVSKYLAMLGKQANFRMCLSGTPMANSPLDIYGQYRFLDPKIFGTNHERFLQEYAMLGGPDCRWVIGFKNQKRLNEKFGSLAYTCKMSDVADRLKLPAQLPPVKRETEIPKKDMATLKVMAKEFIAECGSGFVVVSNVLVKILRMQQITSGYCTIKETPADPEKVIELNTAKEDALADWMQDIAPEESLVVFCVFRHDIDAIRRVTLKANRPYFELSGSANTLDDWKATRGGVIAIQIQSGAEGIDLTKANHAIYYSLPHSLALYEQSKSRLYRPGQQRPVTFTHIIARGTIDESMYASLEQRKDVIESIKDGTFDFGYIR